MLEKMFSVFIFLGLLFVILTLVYLGFFFFNLMIMPIITTGGLIGFVIFIILFAIMISWWEFAPGISKYKGHGGCRFGHVCR